MTAASAEVRSEARKTMLSAIQPTNPMTLGNYLGAIRRWAHYQADYDSLFFAVDQHAITLPQDPELLRENTYRIIATFLAAGLDPQHSLLFIQSHVPEHAELCWVLLCHSYMGELGRMTQFKEKSARQDSNVPAGLFTYPTLMAADILLYQAHLIPVGIDQKQHVELTRDLALRLNHRYQTELFTLPEAFLPSVSAKIMSLQDPTKKMSKSDPDPKATIFVTDTDKQIDRKIKSAVTDSGTVVSYDPSKPGLKNLLDIQAALTGTDPTSLAEGYAGKLYGHLKADTAALVIQALGPIRDEAERRLTDRAELDRVLAEGAQRARTRAATTLARVHRALGFIARPKTAPSSNP